MALIYHAYNRGRSIISRSKVHNAKLYGEKCIKKCGQVSCWNWI